MDEKSLNMNTGTTRLLVRFHVQDICCDGGNVRNGNNGAESDGSNWACSMHEMFTKFWSKDFKKKKKPPGSHTSRWEGTVKKDLREIVVMV
jgi:hypothetical protein